MSFPYEILLRGENGIFKGGHLIIDPFSLPVELTIDNLKDIIDLERAELLRRNIELEKEIQQIKDTVSTQAPVEAQKSLLDRLKFWS